MHTKREMRELHVNSSVIIVFLLFFINSSALGQKKYIIIDSIDSDYQKTHYTLRTKPLYHVDKKVELFNIMFSEGGLSPSLKRKYAQTPPPSEELRNNENKYRDSIFSDRNLILFAALPNLDGKSDWIEVSLDTIQHQMIQMRHLISLYRWATSSAYEIQHQQKSKYLNEYQIIVKRANKYYTPSNCLLQFYAVRNRNEIFNSLFGTINMLQTPRTIDEVKKLFKAQFVYSEFPLYTLREESSMSYFDHLRDRKEFLSEIINTATGNRLYKFWTFTDWREHPTFLR